MIRILSRRVSFAFALALMANLGCLSHERYGEYRQPPERVVMEEQHAPSPQEVVVLQEPPPPPEMVMRVREAPPTGIVERRPPQPSPGAVWVNGYWVRHRDRWVWL